jgi:hypothetical protein
MTPRLLIGVVCLAAARVAASSSCAASVCGGKPTALERYLCVGETLFGSSRDGLYLDHDMPKHIGFGNAIKSLYMTSGVALLTGRSVVTNHPKLRRMFDPPFGGDWVDMPSKATATFAEMTAPAFADFNDKVVADPAADSYRSHSAMTMTSMWTAPHFLTSNDCVRQSMPLFHKYASLRHTAEGFLDEQLMASPFFTALLSKPSDRMVRLLAQTRKRLALPALEPGLEHTPGVWGLRTPGQYLFALHVRHHPVGFESQSVFMTNRRPEGAMALFWAAAKERCAEAKAAAATRGETMLVYFATDDPFNLRADAERELSSCGRVVFGLDEKDVGHMTTNKWSKRDQEQLDKARQHNCLDLLVNPDAPTGGHSAEGCKRPIKLSEVSHEPSVKELHGDYSMLEWWVLASAHELVSNTGSSFSETASSVGLGPLGAMTRYLMVNPTHSKYDKVVRRPAWYGDSNVLHGAEL